MSPLLLSDQHQKNIKMEEIEVSTILEKNMTNLLFSPKLVIFILSNI